MKTVLNQRIGWKDGIYIGYLLLLALLPFGGMLLSWALILCVLLWIVNWDWKNKLISIRQQRWILIPVGLYMLAAIGFFYSENLDEAEFKLVQKLALLIIPVLFVSVPLSIQMFEQWLIRIFTFSLLLSCIVNEVYAFYRYSKSHNVMMWLYNDYSFAIHPTYFAILLCIALTWCLLQFIYKAGWWNYLLSIFFLINLIQSSSRAGILSFTIVCIVIGIVVWQHREAINRYVIIGLVAFPLLFVFATFYLSGWLRLQNLSMAEQATHVSPTAPESGQIRILIWREALHLIKQQPVIGYGTGDVNDVLDQRYLQSGMTSAYEKHLNAHNQYLQNFLANGLVGFLLLTIFLAYGLWQCLRSQHWLGFSFFGLLAFHFLFESILERREGLFIFALFASVFLSRIVYEKSSSPR